MFISDIGAALAASVYPILVLTGLGSEQLRELRGIKHGSFLVVESLKCAVQAILQGNWRSKFSIH